GAAVDRKNRGLASPVAVAVSPPTAFLPVAPSPAVTEIDPPGFASELDLALVRERAPTMASELELAPEETPEELGPEPTAPVDAAEVIAMLASAAAEVVDVGGVADEAEIGDDDVVEEIDEVAEIAEVAEVAGEAHESMAAAQDVTGVSTPILLIDPYLDDDDEVVGAPTDDPDADPGRTGLLIDDDVDAAMFEGDAAHAELELDPGEPALLTAPTTALPDADARLADQLDRALAYAEDHDDEDFGFASPHHVPVADEPEDDDDEDDDFEILAEAAAEDADLAPIQAGDESEEGEAGEEDFVSRLELSRMVDSAPEDPLAGFRDSVMSFGDEQRPYRAPTDPLAGFDDEAAPSYDPGTGSYTYAHRPADYQTPLEPTAADPDLENVLEALDVDLDELGGTGEHLAVPVQPSFNIGSPRRPQAAPAPRADDGVLIQFEDDE
ncbi:MAG: hypothetical protein NT062_04815, partial [Proteobacteria bacterium]|nr:hypothetical protein [Pseudomonadota bacterium]